MENPSQPKNLNINTEGGNYIEFIKGNYNQGNITNIYNTINNLGEIPKPKGFPQNIPLSSTNKFVGRAIELSTLYQNLEKNQTVAIAPIEGMGGVGKTELAIQYSLLHLQLNSYPGGICWVQAREQDISLQIISFSITHLGLTPPDNLELLDRVNWCWQRWREGNTLIVVDDVTDYQIIKPYLPPQLSKFKLLITTRLKLDLPSSLLLEVLGEEEALKLLGELIGEDKKNQELEKAEELCDRIGCLPLALQLVGRYIKRREISIQEMLKRLEEKGIQHRALDVAESDKTITDSNKRGVKAAFELSWEELDQQAQELGCLLSLFALAPIPWILVESVLPEKDSEDIEDARIELENLHLLQRKDDDYQLHQLIQEFFIFKQSKLNIADEQKYNFCKMIVEEGQKIPETAIQSEIIVLTPVIPHLAEAATMHQNWLSDENLISPFIGLGRYYQGQGAYLQALPWYEQCLKVCKERLGDEHPYVATSLNNLAGLYRSQGRYESAEPLLKQALDMRRQMLGESHPDVAHSLNNLALLYKSQGRYESAEPLYLQALDMRRRLLGESHLDVAQSLSNLAGLYYSQGRYESAEPLYLQTLDIKRRLLGESHPSVALSLNNLAYLYYSQGRYELAEPLYLQALDTRKRLLGESHPSVATSINSLALLYYSQGRYELAEPLYLQALDTRKRLLGESHPSVALSLDNLALLYYSQGRYELAEPLYLQALDMRKGLLGESHPDVANSLNGLALLYYSQGRYESAEPLYLQALKIAEVSLRVNHPTTIKIRENLQLLLNKKA